MSSPVKERTLAYSIASAKSLYSAIKAYPVFMYLWMSAAVPITFDMFGNPAPLAFLLTQCEVSFIPCVDGNECALPDAQIKKDNGKKVIGLIRKVALFRLSRCFSA